MNTMPDSRSAFNRRLLADIGGTHARFAMQSQHLGRLENMAVYQCAHFASLELCVRHYLADHPSAKPTCAAMGIATQVMGDWVSMPNNPWAFSTSALQQALRLEQLLFINDFTALALSLPDLESDDLHRIHPGQPQAGAPLALVGPGTGLGVSGLFATAQGSFVAISGEGGHVTLSADNPYEVAVLDFLQKRFGHASAERALSGPGLLNLYDAVCAIDDRPCQHTQPHEVMDSALSHADPAGVAALGLFFSFLGSICGNLALTLGARGGLYLGGGIVPRALAALEQSQFLSRYLQKGRYQDYLQQIPISVITADIFPALKGAARALDMKNQA